MIYFIVIPASANMHPMTFVSVKRKKMEINTGTNQEKKWYVYRPFVIGGGKSGITEQDVSFEEALQTAWRLHKELIEPNDRRRS
jgi:hypothetical protein